MGDLVFQTRDELFSIRYEAVVGWKYFTEQETRLLPHPDPKLAAKGETVPSAKRGDKRLVGKCILLSHGGEKFAMSPQHTAEFKAFLSERVKADVWVASDDIKADITQLDEGVAGAA